MVIVCLNDVFAVEKDVCPCIQVDSKFISDNLSLTNTSDAANVELELV